MHSDQTRKDGSSESMIQALYYDFVANYNIAPLPRSSPSRVTFMYESPSEGRRPGYDARRAVCQDQDVQYML